MRVDCALDWGSSPPTEKIQRKKQKPPYRKKIPERCRSGLGRGDLVDGRRPSVANP
jgi:hypothetical protein